MINIPKIPEKEELEYKEKEFLLSIYEQWQVMPRGWIYVLLAVIVLSIPGYFLLKKQFSDYFISSYEPPVITQTVSYQGQEPRVLKIKALPVADGMFSAYAQIVNPNPDVGSQKVPYTFEFLDAGGAVLKKVPGQSYLLPNESKFLLLPTATLAKTPAEVKLVFDKITWSRARAKFDPELEILQKKSGLDDQGHFFVEGLLKNSLGFSIKRVEIGATIFDKINRNVIAINSTVINDLRPFESRYFRLSWPVSGRDLFGSSGFGQIGVTPSVNVLASGLILETGEKIPAR